MIEPVEAMQHQLAITWSSGELQDGDWITVMPNEVVCGTDAHSPTSPEDICVPWAHPTET